VTYGLVNVTTEDDEPDADDEDNRDAGPTPWVHPRSPRHPGDGMRRTSWLANKLRRV
jgi:hypothetical protein